MAACMQQHEVPCRYTAQRVQHLVDVDDVLVGIVVRVRFQIQARAPEKRYVIRPGRLTRPDRRIGSRSQDKAGSNAQRTRSAGRLNRHQAIRIDAVREGEFLHRGVERRVAGRPDIGLATLRVHQALLGNLDYIEHRRLALGRAKDANAQVNLLGTRVIVVFGNQAENRVGFGGL